MWYRTSTAKIAVNVKYKSWLDGAVNASQDLVNQAKQVRQQQLLQQIKQHQM
jgi:hypothetical protein